LWKHPIIKDCNFLLHFLYSYSSNEVRIISSAYSNKTTTIQHVNFVRGLAVFSLMAFRKSFIPSFLVKIISINTIKLKNWDHALTCCSSKIQNLNHILCFKNKKRSPNHERFLRNKQMRLKAQFIYGHYTFTCQSTFDGAF